MLTYLFLLLLNIGLALFAEQSFNNSRKGLCKVSLAILAIVNVLIIGLRDIGVGTDTLLYIDHYYYYARNLNLKNLVSDDLGFDKGFVILAYIANYIGDKSNALLFATECFIMTFIVLGIYNLKQTINCNIVWFIILFSLLYQFDRINLMRQFCAMSLLFYAYSLFLQKKYAPYIIYQIIAYFFHTSSVLFIIVPFCELISHSNARLKYIFAVGMFILFPVCIIFFYRFLNYVEDFMVLKETYYERYGESSAAALAGGSFSIKYCIYFFFQIFICHYLWRKKKVNSDTLYMILLLSTITFFLAQMIIVIIHFLRLSLYTGLILIVYISSLFKCKSNYVLYLLYAYIFFVSITSCYFWDNKRIMYAHLPYKSQILGIE